MIGNIEVWQKQISNINKCDIPTSVPNFETLAIVKFSKTGLV